MRIINIAGVQFAVSDQDYNYYWNQRNVGEESDSFITACRRILGLGPDCHKLDISFIRGHIWGDNKENCIQKILDSGLVEYEEKFGDGRGDRLEGTIATFNIWDFENSLPILRKYSHYTDLLKIQNGNRIYLKRKRDMQLPCFCLYYLKNSMFICPEKSGIQKLKTSIPYSYFRDFADNMSPEEVQKLPEDERPVLIVIENYPEFKRRLTHKLIEIGLLDCEIIETKVDYFDFDQYGDIDLKESGTSGIEIGTNGTKTGTNKSAWRISIEHTPSVNEKTTGFFKVLGSLRENKKETAKPYIHCFAVPNKKIGVTGFEPATSTSRT